MEKRTCRTQQIQMSFSRMTAARPERAAAVSRMSPAARQRAATGKRQPPAASGEETSSATAIQAGMSAEHSFRNCSGRIADSILATDRNRSRRRVVHSEIPERRERKSSGLPGKLETPTVRGMDHPDGDVADPDRAAERAGMENGHRRRLCAERETLHAFGAVDLDGLAVVPGDGPDNLGNAGKDSAGEAVLPCADEDALGQTFDLALPDGAGARAVDGAARTVGDEARGRERPASRQFPDVGAIGFHSGYGRVLLCLKTYESHRQITRAGGVAPTGRWCGRVNVRRRRPRIGIGALRH